MRAGRGRGWRVVWLWRMLGEGFVEMPRLTNFAGIELSRTLRVLNYVQCFVGMAELQ